MRKASLVGLKHCRFLERPLTRHSMLIIARSRRSGRTIRKTRRRRIGLQDLHRRYAFAKNWRLLRSPVFFWEITLPRDALERRVPKGLYQVPEGLTLGFPDQRRVDSRLANTRGSPCPLRFGLILTLRWLGWPRSGRRTGRRRGGF